VVVAEAPAAAAIEVESTMDACVEAGEPVDVNQRCSGGGAAARGLVHSSIHHESHQGAENAYLIVPT